MTIRSHPDPSVLISYASGALPGAISGVVACHLSMCLECSANMQTLEAIGGIMLDRFDPVHSKEATEGVAAKRTLERDRAQLKPDSAPAPGGADDPILPLPLVRYLGMTADQIPWKKLPKGVQQYWVKLPKGAGSMRLLRAPPGVQLLKHSHRGMELTMVLKGIYSDHTGDYRRGEVTEMNEGTEHQPRISSEEECICLVASEKPSRYSLWYARLLQPIFGY